MLETTFITMRLKIGKNFLKTKLWKIGIGYMCTLVKNIKYLTLMHFTISLNKSKKFKTKSCQNIVSIQAFMN